MSPPSDEDIGNGMPAPQQQMYRRFPRETRNHENRENSIQGSGTMNNGSIRIEPRYYVDIGEVNFFNDTGLGLEDDGQSDSAAEVDLERASVSNLNLEARNIVSDVAEPLTDGQGYLSEQDEQDYDSSDQDDSFDEKYGRPFRQYVDAKPIIDEIDGVSAPLRKSQAYLKKIRIPNATLSTRAQTLGRLLRSCRKRHRDIKRELDDSPVVRTGGEDPSEDEGLLIRLTEKAKDARRKAQAVENRARIISGTVQPRSSRPRPPVFRQEALDLELVLFRHHAHAVMESLKAFLSVFQNFCLPNPPDRFEARVLNTLSASRDASGVLCQRLSRLCPEHQVHQLYFSVGREGDVGARQNAVSFVLACQRTGAQEKEDNLVWIRAKPAPPSQYVTHEEVEALPSSHEVRFCLARLQPDFDFRLGETRLSCLPSNDAGKRSPIPISEWIKMTWRDKSTRISLARMIAEVVLSLNPTLWRQTCLRATKVFVVSPKYEKIESHVKIRLEQPIKDIRSYDRTSTEDWKAPPIQKVLLDLGLTLLELAYIEIPEEERQDLMTAPIGPEKKSIRDKCCNDALKNEMGTRYADVTRFCLLESNREGEMYDLETQKIFYQKVIRPLQMEEEEMSGMMKKLQDVARNVLPASG